MSAIRVVHLVWRLSSTGGIPRVVRDLATSLDPKVIETSVVSVRPRYPEDHIDDVVDADHFRSAGHPLGASRTRLPLVVARVTRELRRLQPDVLHLHSGTAWMGIPAALSMPKVRRLLDVHDDPTSGRSGRLNVASMKASVRRMGFHVVTHSTYVRAMTAAAFGMSDNEIDIVPLGVDVERFQPDPVRRKQERQRLGLKDDQPLITWVGRLDRLKRPLDAVAVAKRVLEHRPDAVFAIAGSGTEQEALEQAIGERADSVRLFGRVDDLLALLNASDVYLSTSTYEGFGLSVLEAMACGLPIVATDSGGVQDLVSDAETGYLVPVQDVSALAERIQSLLGDATTRGSLGEAALKTATKSFSQERMASEYTQHVRDLVREA